MRAFVVRPFGTREGIDFEAVGAELIAPALLDMEYSGNTTQAIDLVAHVIDPLPGKVLVTELEHHSNDLPYRKRGPLLRARVDGQGRLFSAGGRVQNRSVSSACRAVVRRMAWCRSSRWPGSNSG